MKNDIVGENKHNLFRIFALGITLAGAFYSLILTIHAGQNNKSTILPLLFVTWVLSPFSALIVANISFTRRSYFSRIWLYILMTCISFGSLLGYTHVFSPFQSKPAGVFLIVPLISWLLIAISYFIVSKRNKITKL